MSEQFQSRVAIIGGSGHLGHAMARRLHAARIEVVVGSRDAARAREAAQAIGLPPDAGRLNVDAARWAELIVLTVPTDAHRQVLTSLAPVAADKVLLDTTVRLGSSSEPAGSTSGSMAEEARTLLPSTRVVAGFHTVSSAMLADLTRAPHGDVLICGDDPGSKDLVAGLARAVGMRAVDAGDLRQARMLESLVALLLKINRRYKRRDLGITIAGLP